MAAMFFACHEESLDQNQPKTLKAQTLGITFSVENGTRRQLRRQVELAESLGLDPQELIDNGPCLGRSICFLFGETIGVISGGIWEADVENLSDESMYSFLITPLNESFELRVMPDYITPSVKDIVFEGDVFIMDEDFEFPDWVCEMFNVETIVLPQGTYPITELEDGTVYFEF